MKTKLLLLCLGLLWPTLSFSQAWWTIASTPDGTSCRIEIASIKKNGDLLYAWDELSYSNEDARLKEARKLTEKFGDGNLMNFSRYLYYYVYDISISEAKCLEMKVYDQQGNTLRSFSWSESELKYSRTAPGSLGMIKLAALKIGHVFEFEHNGNTRKDTVPTYGISDFLDTHPEAKYAGDIEELQLILSKWWL